MKERLISLLMLATFFGTLLISAKGGENPDPDYRDPEVHMIDSIYYRIKLYAGHEASVATPLPFSSLPVYPKDRKSMVIPSTITYKGTEYTVTKVEDDAFHYESFETLSIPSTVKDFGYSSIPKCLELETITVDEDNESYTSVNGVLYNKDKTRLLAYPKKKWADGIVIPEGVESLGYAVFSDYDDDSVKRISLPSTLKELDLNCFEYFEAESFKLPEGLESIPFYAFHGASSADSTLVIPSTVSYIEGCSFSESGFKNIILPEGIDKIKDSTFAESALENITIPGAVTEIGSYAFAGTKSLKSIELPENLTNIEMRAFCNSGLTSITIRSNVSVLEEMVFAYCENLRSVTIGENIREISDSFMGCASLSDIYCEGMTAPIIDEEYPLGKDDEDWIFSNGRPPFTRATVHVRKGALSEYGSNGWDKIGPILQDLTDGIEDVMDDGQSEWGQKPAESDVCTAYTPDGTIVADGMTLGEMHHRLPAGLYIIAAPGRKSLKLAL